MSGDDFNVTHHGSIVLFKPLTPEARRWLMSHVEQEGVQWWGGALVVEPRYAADLAQGILEACDDGHQVQGEADLA